MTPKEKAKELVAKFMPHSTGNSNRNEAIECALIAVDEILKVCENEISHCSDKTYFYWQEVKQEIEKL